MTYNTGQEVSCKIRLWFKIYIVGEKKILVKMRLVSEERTEDHP